MSDGSVHEPLRPLSFNLDPQFAELRANLESELHRVHMRLSELRLPPAKRTLGQRLQLMYTSMRVLFLKGSLCAEALEPLSHLLNEFQLLLDNRGSFFGDVSSISTRLDNIATQIDIGLCTLSPRTMASQWPELRDDSRIALKEPLVLPRTQMSPYNTFQGLHDIFPVIITAYPREFRETAYHAIQVWSKLQHPNIMPFVGVSADRVELCIATPFAYKRPLREYLAIDSTVDRLSILYDLARALTYLHTEGIVYGDLHAMNILMCDDGMPILNFTLAIHESSELSSDFRAWRQRTSVPCARYLAPELIANDSMIPTVETDIFALGCVAYELFSGRQPFEEVPSDTISEARVLRGQRPTPERRLRSCGEGAGLIRRLIANAWAQDPRQRPTAVVFTETVKEALQKRGQRDAADSKSLPPIPPDDARSNASSTYEDVEAQQHEERDEAKARLAVSEVVATGPLMQAAEGHHARACTDWRRWLADRADVRSRIRGRCRAPPIACFVCCVSRPDRRRQRTAVPRVLLPKSNLDDIWLSLLLAPAALLRRSASRQHDAARAATARAAPERALRVSPGQQLAAFRRAGGRANVHCDGQVDSVAVGRAGANQGA